jgi:hypothetical protein
MAPILRLHLLFTPQGPGLSGSFMHICEKYNLAGTSPVNFVLVKDVSNCGFGDSGGDSRTDLLEWSTTVTFAIADYLTLETIGDDGRTATLW